jgi:hypothetical protein
MGYRLEGPELKRKQGRDMLSHGVVPGVIQVPPSGQPIILMGDAQTTGGYPKIGVIIGADLWKLAQAPLNATLRLNPASWPMPWPPPKNSSAISIPSAPRSPPWTGRAPRSTRNKGTPCISISMPTSAKAATPTNNC